MESWQLHNNDDGDDWGDNQYSDDGNGDSDPANADGDGNDDDSGSNDDAKAMMVVGVIRKVADEKKKPTIAVEVTMMM